MHPSRVAVVAGAALALASLPLDYLDSEVAGRIAGWSASAWPTVALLGLAALAVLAGDRREGLPGPGTLLVVVLAAAAVVFAVAKLVDAGGAAAVVRDSGGVASIGLGAWVLVVAAIVSLAGAVATTSRRVV